MILVICELVITGLGLELRAAEFTWSPVGGVRTPAGDVWAWLRLELGLARTARFNWSPVGGKQQNP